MPAPPTAARRTIFSSSLPNLLSAQKPIRREAAIVVMAHPQSAHERLSVISYLAVTMARAERWICAMAPKSGVGRTDRLSEGIAWGSDDPETNRVLQAADSLVLPPARPERQKEDREGAPAAQAVLAS